MRSKKAIINRLQEVKVRVAKLQDPKGSPKKKMDWMYAAGYRDALKWVMSHGRS